MAQVLSYTIFGFAIITGGFCIAIAQKGLKSDFITRLMFLASLFSSWWSMFFGLMIGQKNCELAAWLRGIGMIGVFGFLICVSYIAVVWSGVHGVGRTFILLFGWTGVILYPFTVSPSNIIYELTKYGMSYRMTNGLWSNAYAAYSSILAVNMLYAMIYMLKTCEHKRDKVIAYDILVCIGVVFVGCILDTIMPMLGIPAVPGSTIGQFGGMVVLYQAYIFYSRQKITPENMSQIVYYSVDEPVLLFDEHGKLCLVNSGATSFLEMEEEECYQYSIDDIFYLQENVFNFRGNKNHIEARCNFNNNICSLSIDKILDEYNENTGFIVIVSDITERVQNFKRLEEEKQRADRANEAKGAFLANMSHEIRTPINAIMGMNEMILRESENHEILDYAQNIKDASKTLLVLINDILDFSKIESGKMQLVTEAYSLRELLKMLTTECNMRAETKGLAFRIEAPEDTPNILLGDEVRIRQILLNILTNAIKYTEKGSVVLKVSYEKIDTDMIEISFAVKDTGIGIKKEMIPKLFDKFDRGDEKQIHEIEGTGLGLSIVDRLVKLMNGTIQVESVYGEGSTFTVSVCQEVLGEQTIGQLRVMAKKEVNKKKYVPKFIAPKARILAVDDNNVNLAVVKGFLRKTQVQLTCVNSGAKCLELAKNEHFDIILLDHMMPEMDGIETLTRLRQMTDSKSADAVIIVLTANAMINVREMYLEKGFDDYLAKPIEGPILEEILMKYIPKEYITKQEA